MNRRGKRLTLGVMAVGLAVILVLGIVHRDAVRDHVKAWHFQLTRETRTIEPNPAAGRTTEYNQTSFFSRHQSRLSEERVEAPLSTLLAELGDSSGQPVVIDSAEDSGVLLEVGDSTPVTALETNGYRVLEQRFPRRAYVVIPHERYFREDPAAERPEEERPRRSPSAEEPAQ